MTTSLSYRPLGSTGLRVSALSLGTVSLGMDYGIRAPGEYGQPNRRVSIELIQRAADAGINLFDTAPAYGESEEIVGEALAARPDCHIATKVPTFGADRSPVPTKQLREQIFQSLHESRQRLRLDVLEIVQIHNATEFMMRDGTFTAILQEAQQQGLVRFIGASVYGEAAALAVLATGAYHMLQISYNILDQRMTERVFPCAMKAGVALVARSILLKGALTAKAQWLPEPLSLLRSATERVKDTLTISWESLPTTAMRFGLSTPAISSVLVGVRTASELEESIVAAAAGSLPESAMRLTPSLAITDERLLNPTHWNIA